MRVAISIAVVNKKELHMPPPAVALFRSCSACPDQILAGDVNEIVNCVPAASIPGDDLEIDANPSQAYPLMMNNLTSCVKDLRKKSLWIVMVYSNNEKSFGHCQ